MHAATCRRAARSESYDGLGARRQRDGISFDEWARLCKTETLKEDVG